jgi:hypothetical protein
LPWKKFIHVLSHGGKLHKNFDPVSSPKLRVLPSGGNAMRVAMGGEGGAAHLGVGGQGGSADWFGNNLDALIAAAAQENAVEKKKKKTRIWEKADREVPKSEHEELRRDTLVIFYCKSRLFDCARVETSTLNPKTLNLNHLVMLQTPPVWLCQGRDLNPEPQTTW